MRLTYVDTAKFLAIFFVIFSHCNMTSPISAFLFSFHVQLFFICFGYVYKNRDIRLREWLVGGGKKLAIRLMIPFVLLSCIFGHPLTMDFLPRLFYGRITGVSGIAHLWFLPCFFLSAVLFNAICILVKNKLLRLLYIAICAVLSACLSYNANICVPIGQKIIHLTGYSLGTSAEELYWGFPFTANVALSGVVLMYIGYALKRCFDNLSIITKKGRCVSIAVVCLTIGTISYYFNLQYITNDFPFKLITMSWAIYGNYLLFLITSVLLSVSVLCVSALIDNPITTKYGKSTMEIYAFHPFILGVAGTALSILHIPSLGGLPNSVLTLFVCCLLIPIIRKIDSSLVGYKKQ